MSEQWWAIKVYGHMSPGLVFPRRESAKAYSDSSDYLLSALQREDTTIVPVRIVEDAGPCDTEKGMVDPVSYFKEMGYSFCPYCGRTL